MVGSGVKSIGLTTNCARSCAEVTDADPGQQWLQHACLQKINDEPKSAIEVQPSSAPIEQASINQIISDIEDILPDNCNTILGCLQELHLTPPEAEATAEEEEAVEAAT